ncbi:hypothetical protein H0H92_005730 [Tricholoma furcatifolium]|nr:hypothetical protein H0H92_005730 [Tricholoma furcatifolium]
MYYPSSTVSVQSSVVTEDHLHSYPSSWHEAEQIWEGLRQELIARAHQVRSRIVSLPIFSFERTMLEEDERFFNTFPAARLSAINEWIEVTFPYASWLEMPLYPYPSAIDFDQYPPSPPPKFTTYTLGEALTPPPSISSKAALQPSTSEPQGYQQVSEGVSESISSPEEDILFALRVVSPARRPARNTRTILRTSRAKKNIYPTVPAVAPISLPSPPHIPAPATVPSMPSSPKLPRRSGDWETDAIASAESEYLRASANAQFFASEAATVSNTEHLSPQSLVVDIALACEYAASSDHDRVSPRIRSHPYAAAKLSVSSPSSSEESVLPQPRRKRSKLLRDKDGKPIMACWFCRGRKIACGPPPAGSDDPTCNQCLRRGQACHYPTVSRRGQRKKKTDAVDSQPSSSPLPSPSSCKHHKSPVVEHLPSLDELYLMSDDEDDSGSEWDGSA